MEEMQAKNIKKHCHSYILELLKQMHKRLPQNVKQLESLSDLCPSVVLGNQKPQLQQLSFLPLFQGDLAVLDQQWNQLSSVEWPMTDDVEQFWVGVANHKDASGENDFSELSDFILSMLALPFSNSAVERHSPR